MGTAYPTALDTDGTLLIATDHKIDTLRASMTNSQTTIPVNVASTFPDPAPTSGTFYVVIDAQTAATYEICSYTGLDLTGGANALTGVVRHLFGSNTTTHATGVTVEENIVAAYHEFVKAAVIAIETKVGVNASAVNTTHEFKLLGVATGDKAVSLTGTEVLTNKTINGATFDQITISTAISRIIPGLTSLSFRNNANSLDNITITDAGQVTIPRSDLILTVGALKMSASASLIVPGATSLSLRNNANSADNLLVTDAGNTTVRGLLTASNALTVSAGAMTVNTAGVATYNRQYYAAKFSVAFSATPTFDFNNSNVQQLGSMTANVTTVTFSNPQSGGRYVLLLPQDGTGGRTVAWPGSVKWPSGVAPTLSGANKTDVVGLVYDGATFFGTSGLNY